MAVEVEVHTLEVALYDVCYVVGGGACGVRLHGGLRVLRHYHAVLVVGIGDGEGTLRQVVEELLLCVAVVLERLVVVEVVARQVGEESTGEGQSADAVLRNGVAGALHKGVFAASIHHLCEEHVQLYGVRCGVVGGECLVLHVVANGGEQARLVAHLAEHII